MRCEETEANIAEYLAGTLRAGSPLIEHLAMCEHCRTEVETLRGVWKSLDDISVPRTPRVMQPRLVAALAELQPLPRRRPMPYVLKPILMIMLSAGALLIGRTFERTVENSDAAHYRGAPNARWTLVQYGDYACPPCDYNSVVNDVLKHYGNRLRLEFRHFPLTTVHPNAVAAAVAAEAAGEQGHYWQMHDLLFSSQRQWTRLTDPEPAFIGMAATIGLDAAAFRQSLQKPELRQRVMDDLKKGQEANVQAVPAFFLDARRIEHLSQSTAEALIAAIDAQMQYAK
jgi:protein-disulfide isomerase